MLEVTTGNILDSKAQTLVNTVNCVGVMGKGIALAFKQRFPDMYKDYAARCSRGEVRLGRPYVYRPLFGPWILNFPTKKHWRSVSRLEDIIQALEYLEGHYREWGITSLAVPPLGCGNGQLQWQVVGPILYRHLTRLDIPVTLYAPEETTTEQRDSRFLASQSAPTVREVAVDGAGRLEPAWIALAEIIARIHAEPYHVPVGRVTFQKVAYFATEAGLPTGFRYVAASFGPFTHDLKPALTRLVNNGVLREEQQGNSFAVEPGATYRDAARAWRHQLEDWEALIERVTDLFMRVRSTRQAEVAATAHFAAHRLMKEEGRVPSEKDVFEAVKQWKRKRRPPLTDEEIADAVRNLNALGWLELRSSDDLPLSEDELLYA